MDRTVLKKMMSKKSFKALMSRNRISINMNTGTRTHKDMRDPDVSRRNWKQQLDSDDLEL